MQKHNIVIIILSFIIVGLLFILFIGKNNFDKDIEEANKKAGQFEKQIKEYEDKIVLTEKEFEDLSEKEKVVVYKEVIKEKQNIIDTSKEILAENEKLIKNLDKCNTKLKRKDKLLLNGLVGLGLDQEFNFTAMAGGTLSGKIYDGMFTRVYLGGGGVYTFRTDFNHQINGGNLIFNITFTF